MKIISKYMNYLLFLFNYYIFTNNIFQYYYLYDMYDYNLIIIFNITSLQNGERNTELVNSEHIAGH